MVSTKCQRCLQEFSSVSRLKSHLARKNPCKQINFSEMSIESQQKPIIENATEEIDKFPLRFCFDLKLDKNTGNSTVIFGSSKAGKSTLLMDIYKNNYSNFISVLFTESPQLKMFKDKKLIISDFFLPEIVKDMHRINKGTKNNYNFSVLVDDIVDQKENTLIKKLILIFRNSNISSVVSLQSPKLLSKANRGSINNYIFFKFNTDEMIEEIIKLFLSSFLPGKMTEKIQLYKQLTNNHQFIYFRPRESKISVHKLIC